MSLVLRRILYSPARWWLRRQVLPVPVDASKIRRILLLRYDAIGDVIVTLPMVDVLRERIPGVEIHIVTSPLNNPVVDADPRIQRTFIWSRKLRDLPRLALQLRPQRYDMVIGLVMHKTTESGMVANAAVGRRGITVSFAHPGRQDLYAAWFNIQAPVKREAYPMAEMQIRLINHVFGWKEDAQDFPIRLLLSEDARQYAIQQTSWMSSRRIALNISAGADERMLSFEKNSEIVRGVLHAIPKSSIVITCAPDRSDMAKQLQQIDPTRVRAVDSSKTVVGALAVMERVHMLISPDTGLLHGAAGFQTPMVGLYSHYSSVVEWAPFNVPYRAVFTSGRVPMESLDMSAVLRETIELAKTLWPSDSTPS